MNRNFFRNCTTIGAVAALAACGGDATAPNTAIAPSLTPEYSATVPFNNDAACMYTDATRAPTGTVSGVKLGDAAASALNCTANDVSIATAELKFYSIANLDGTFPTPTAYVPGSQVSCPEGRPIQLTMSAKLKENATSERFDIGVWLATNGGDAKVGACKHFNLLPGGGVTNDDNDSCGDLNVAASVPNFDLGTFNSICQVNPNPPAGATPEQLNSLHIGSCLGWTEPGANRVCPTSTAGPDGFRFGTLPGNKSKCNCDGFDVPIVIAKTAKLEVAKVCSPTTDAGTFDLLIDNGTSVNGVVVGDNKACATGTGAQILTAGTNAAPGAVHSFGEGDFTTANYTSSYSCVNRVATGAQHVFTAAGDAAATGTALGPNQITLKPGEDVVCTYTNTRVPAKIELKKALSPTDDPGKFNLFVKSGATTVASATDVGDGGTTGAGGTSVAPGSYDLSEAAGTGTTIGNYTVTGPSCVKRSDNSAVNVTTGSVTVASNDDIICTITNTRNGGKLELTKSLSPAADPGKFNLFVKSGATTVASATDVGDGGTTGAGGTSLAPGSYALSEAAGTGTAIGDYTVTGPSCKNRGDNSAVNVSAGSVTLASNADVICTITNTRNPGKLELTKSLSPAADPGKFNLFIKSGATTVASATDVGNGGTTGAGGTSLAPGSYDLSEAAGTGTTIGDYTVTGPSCKNRGDNSAVNVSAGAVTLASNADVICTITNTRNGGKLELTKALSPTTDAGLFNLFIKSGATTVASATDVGNGGTTGAGGTSLAPGSYALSEAAGTGTAIGDYTVTGPSCKNRGDNSAVNVSAGSVTLVSNADVICTITNTRNGGKLELKKALSPAADPGKFNLFIKSGATTVASATDVGNGGTTGAGGTSLATGSYALSETAGTATSLGDYTTTGPACVNRGDNSAVNVSAGSVTLVSNADVVCTITNTRNQLVNSIIAPTQTTCEQYAGGNRILEPSMQAGLKGRVINNVSPGVIFFYSTVTVNSAGSILKVVQSNTPADNTTPFPAIAVSQGQAYVYTYNASTQRCTQVATFTNLTGDPTTTLNAGTYIVQIKYNPNSLTGYTIATPVNAKFPVVYAWGTQLNGAAVNNIATNNLTKK